MCCRQEVTVFAILQHIEAFTKGEVAHDIERVVAVFTLGLAWCIVVTGRIKGASEVVGHDILEPL